MRSRHGKNRLQTGIHVGIAFAAALTLAFALQTAARAAEGQKKLAKSARAAAAPKAGATQGELMLSVTTSSRPEFIKSRKPASRPPAGVELNWKK